jgi:isopenicillin N synthase-like dioxygenase
MTPVPWQTRCGANEPCPAAGKASKKGWMDVSEQIPVIDIGNIDRVEDGAAVLEALDHALCNWGFFQAVNHGVPDAVIAALHAEMRAFFALPSAAKHAIERTAENSWGFYDKELTKNRLDCKEIFDFGPDIHEGPLAGHHVRWPKELPTLRPAMAAFYAACESVSFRLLDAIARCLGASANHLRSGFLPQHTSFLRLNHYPRCDHPAGPDTPTGGDGQFGIGHHTDSGALTVLVQDDQPGLQVHRGGRWTLVQPRRDALVINIGDIVQVWSNDRYPAGLHRVLVNRSAERYSAPFFFNPAYELCYAPLPSICTALDPPHYRPINWGEFRAGRSAGDYADHGEEIQIAHFRVG